MTAEEITDDLLTEYEAFFDIQTVRRKCNAYQKEGLLQKQRKGKTVVYSLDTSLAQWLKSNETILDALAFFQLAGNLGMIGNQLTDQFDYQNQTFRVKHSFFVHTLEDEILLDLLNIIRQQKSAALEIKSSKKGIINTTYCVPLQIFISTRSGRRFLCAYIDRSKRFTCFRLDTIKKVTPLEKTEAYEELQTKLNRNRRQLWGVSFQGRERHHLDKLTMTIQVFEPKESYIVDRLRREGRGGTVTKTAPNIYQYEIEVFDCNEMLPWIRTFIGRILSLECSAKSVERRFYEDLQTMYQTYQIEE